MKKRLITVFISIIFFGLITASIISEIAIAAPGEITVNSPTNGSEYYEGDTIYINWSYFDVGDYVKIELIIDGSSIYTISSNTSCDGSYSWIIPSGYAEQYYSYTIRVTDLEVPNESGDSGFFFIYEKSITVTSPTSGDIWFKGGSNTITWDSENAGNYMRIELYTGGSYYSTITSSTYNDGLHSWLISSTLSSDSEYQIKITSTTDSTTYDYSAYFTIGERSITITTPSGGETWYRGEKNTIRWSSENAGSLVRIQYKHGSSYSWSTIVTSTSNTGSYEWTIPSYLTLNSQYQIRISSTTYSSVYDMSSFFTIDERYIRIDSPDYFDTWYPNETYLISWSSKNAGNTVDIRLVKNDVHCAWIGTNLDNSGGCSWTISDVFASDSTYQIEIRSKQYSSVYDLSDMFSIGKRSILITSPEAGVTLYMGDSFNIDWESEDAGNTVEIELYKDGEYYLTIDSYVPSSGSYSWKIPTDLPESQSYQIRIVSSSYDDVYGYSAGNFTIEQTLFQKVTAPLLILIIFIVVLAVATKVIIKFRKKRDAILDENAMNQQQFMQTPTQFNQTEFTQEEYENIWEGGNL